MPPTDSMVWPHVFAERTNKKTRIKILLTKAEAVGPSRMPNSSCVNGRRGISHVRRGINNRMIIGNPIAAARLYEPNIDTQTTKKSRTDSLRDSHGSAKGHKLHTDEQEHTRPSDFPQRLVGVGQGPVPQEIQELPGDSVTLKSVRSHVPATKHNAESSTQYRNTIGLP